AREDPRGDRGRGGSGAEGRASMNIDQTAFVRESGRRQVGRTLLARHHGSTRRRAPRPKPWHGFCDPKGFLALTYNRGMQSSAELRAGFRAFFESKGHTF